MRARRIVVPRARPALVMALLVALLAALLVPVVPAGAVPSGFVDELVVGGLQLPTAVAFAPAADGRVFIAEKSGIVKVLDGPQDRTPSQFADLRTNVHDIVDRGLLGIAVNPDFPADPSVHVLYSHDAEIGGTAPRWNDGCDWSPARCTASGRLSRLPLRADGTAGREQVLIEDWCGSFPSHSVGALVFGPDGALYASAGDGARPTTDYGQEGEPPNPCGDPPSPVGTVLEPPTAEGGSLRAQDLRTGGDPVTLDGTIIRVDPDTGDAWSGNPLASSGDPNARRIIAMGLRNPFRFALHPATGDLWVGDVGRFRVEEVNRIRAPRPGAVPNFGWPCYEGPNRLSAFDVLDFTICEGLYAEGSATGPVFSYAHGTAAVPGDGCSLSGGDSVTGGAFAQGSAYPEAYRGAYFFGDYARGCLWAMLPTNGAPDPAKVQAFSSEVGGIVDLKAGPDGHLYYVRIGTGSQDGELRRIRSRTGDQPPMARLTATPTSGDAPLDVAFDARASTDPEGGALTFAWDLDGDGAYDDATGATTTRTYTDAGEVAVRVRVRDPGGQTATAGTQIVVGRQDAPPTARITAPAADLRWEVGQAVTVRGTGTSAGGDPLPDSALSWSIVLHHCIGGLDSTDCHRHPQSTFVGPSATFPAPEHDWPAFLELRLTATDPATGRSDTTTRRIDPRAVDVTVTSTPAGAVVAAGGDPTRTPFTTTFIVGSSITLAAPSTQTIDGRSHTFASWSDGGAATHTTTVGSRPRTHEVTYVPSVAPPRLAGADRIATALESSRRFWADGSQTVVLARADDFPDALAGGPLAELSGAPILLTPPDALDDRVRQEIARLDAAEVVLLGGEAALSPAVASALAADGFGVTRLAGRDRYATAEAIDRQMDRDAPAAVVATGEDFPDALTAMNLLPPRIQLSRHDRFDHLHPEYTYTLIGGASVLGEVVAASTGGMRIAGANRYDTAARVLDEAVATRGAGPLFLTTGTRAPDALAAGAAVAATGGYLLVVDPVRGPNAAQREVLARHAAHFTGIYALGGRAALPDEVVAAVSGVLAGGR